MHTVVNGSETADEPAHHDSASFLLKVDVVTAVLGGKFSSLSVVMQLHVRSFLHEAMEIRATLASNTVIFFMRYLLSQNAKITRSRSICDSASNIFVIFTIQSRDFDYKT